jgi:hypothetical protein
VYSAISSIDFSSRSGGTDGRPTLLYIAPNTGESSLSTRSVMSRILRSG